MPNAHKLAKTAVRGLVAASKLAADAGRFRSMQKKAQKRRSALRPNKEEITMKKSTFAAILAFIAAATGALVAAALYIRRREKELDEYEQLLFSEDFNDAIEDDDEDEETVPAPETPAEPEADPEA